MSTDRVRAALVQSKYTLRRIHSFICAASHRPVSALEGFSAGLAFLAVLFVVQLRLGGRLAALDADYGLLSVPMEQAETALEAIADINALKSADLEKMKAAMVGLARKQKQYYEERLALSEERRQLEKQLDLIETHILADPAAGKIKVMRGDQAVKDYPFAGVSCWGDLLRGTAPKPPRSSQVTAKEYFAHPERGEVKIQEGKLVWTPPQVGDVSRSDALGQYVVFTNAPFILHAPSRKREAHEAYPHCCLNMTAAVAKKVYDAVYIGTRIAILPKP